MDNDNNHRRNDDDHRHHPPFQMNRNYNNNYRNNRFNNNNNDRQNNFQRTNRYSSTNSNAPRYQNVNNRINNNNNNNSSNNFNDSRRNYDQNNLSNHSGYDDHGYGHNNHNNNRQRYSSNHHHHHQHQSNSNINELPPRFARKFQNSSMMINDNRNNSRNQSDNNQHNNNYHNKHNRNYHNNHHQQQNYHRIANHNESDRDNGLSNRFDRMNIRNNRGDYRHNHNDYDHRMQPSTSNHNDDDNINPYAINNQQQTSRRSNQQPHQRSNRLSSAATTSEDKHINECQREIMDELLRKQQYECMICCEMIRITDRIWNCHHCFNIFHLKCIQKWSYKSTLNQNDSNLTTNNNQTSDEWRCPTCQSIYKQKPRNYYCFCGKQRDPELNNFCTPHSCGDVCQRNLDKFNPKNSDDTNVDDEEIKDYFKCDHKCLLQCHPGKCPQCTAKVERRCSCGKTKVLINCTAKMSEIICPEKCSKLLNCGRHYCDKNCHFNRCKPCDKRFDLKCYCGRNELKNVKCIDIISDDNTDGINGYTCNELCLKYFECNIHQCQRKCHKNDCGKCPLSPELIEYCPCGKTRLSSIANRIPRTSCTDPIETCGKICDKALKCGTTNEKHRCKTFCHPGECPPCDQSTIVRCVCGANSQKLLCKDLQQSKNDDDNNQDGNSLKEYSFKCKRKCNKKLSCGRHKCNKECCIDKEHQCRQKCGRKLVCGKHQCEEPCHQFCRSCPNVIWTEITCNCGHEILYPPQPCGTSKPPCKRPCSRQHPCDHPPNHQCHDDDECPPCIEFVSKLCYGGHEIRDSVHCYETGVSCGNFCQKPLPCQMHKCSKICHPGDCPDCQQKCTRIRENCLHQCALPCHQTKSKHCPDSPCHERIKIFCECEFKSKEVECHEVADRRQFDQQLNDLIKRYNFNLTMSLDEMKDMVRYNLKHSLQCDHECAREKRNRNLAVAFGIDNHDQNNGGDNSAQSANSSANINNQIKYSEQLKNDARTNPKFIMMLQDKFAQLIDAYKESNQKIMCYNFQPMNRQNREIIHSYAAHYGLKTESVDKEPNRSVIIIANKHSQPPKPTLLEAVNIDVKQLRPKPTIVKYKTASEESRNKKIVNCFDD